jgi:hypothetical protein
MPLRALIAALVFAVICGRAAAADVIGYSEAFDTLYRVDLTTQTALEIGRATPIGSQRYSLIDGLTFSPDGRLYAVSDAASVKTLLQINATTGLATPIGVLNLNTDKQLDLGLAFTSDGKLWLSSGPGMFWQVNPADASVTLIGNLGVKVTGLTSRGNVLYGAGSQGTNNLYLIDQNNAQATLIGAYGSEIGLVSAASPAFDAAGQLWVVLDYIPFPGSQWSDLARVETAGSLNNLGAITAPTNSQSATDLAFIGLRGLAIISPSGVTVATDSMPALSGFGMASLIAVLALFAGTRLRRRRPNV